MFELSWSFILLGIFSGTVAGILPGLGMTVLMIMSTPFLINYQVHEIIQFYLGAILTSQFIGSIVATYFAVPGEPSSIPAVIEGNKLARQGKGTEAIFLSAIGSFVGGIIAFAFIWVLGQNLGEIFKFFTTGFNIAVITLVVVVLFLMPAKNYIEKFIFPLLGLFLGMIGQASYDVNVSFDLGIDLLETGIPTMPFMLGLYTLPLLLVLIRKNETDKSKIQSFRFRDVVFGLAHFVISVLHAILGFIVAFIPGVSLSVVSNFCYELQKKFNAKLKKSQEGQYNLIAAETSNNSGAISVVLPLLLFGIPTTVSQALLFDILVDKAHMFGPLSFDITLVNSILQVLLLTSIVGFILAGPMGICLGKIFEKFEKKLYIIVSILMIFVTIYIGNETYDLTMYVYTLLFSFILGWLWRNMDVLRIIYFFIISPFLVENWTRMAFILDII